MLLWLEFLGVSAVILFSGTRLTRYGDVISEKSGLSRLWLGMVLMAGVTSLPELATGLSAVASDMPDIAWAWDSFGVMLVYAVNLVLLYLLR